MLIELLGPEVCTLDEEGQRTAQLTMDEMKILWHRSEENRKASPSPSNNHQLTILLQILTCLSRLPVPLRCST